MRTFRKTYSPNFTISKNVSFKKQERSCIKYKKDNLSNKLRKCLYEIDYNHQTRQKKERLSENVKAKKQNRTPSRNLRIRQIERITSRSKSRKKIQFKRNQRDKRRCPSKKKTILIQNKVKERFSSDFRYYKNDITEMIYMGEPDRIENSTQYNHVLLGIHVAKTYYLKTKQMKKFGEITKKLVINLKQTKKQEKTKILLLFDIDETLVHTLREGEYDNYEDKQEIWVQNQKQKSINFYVNIRPYAKQFLRKLSRNSLFSLGVFTASQKTYADKIIGILDPDNRIFSCRFYRDSCERIQNFHAKNLEKLKNINIKQTILIDNCPYSYMYQPNNAIPIFPFLYEKDDDQLQKLQFFIKNYICSSIKSFIVQNVDVRDFLKRYFKLQEYTNYRCVKKLVLQLYRSF